MPFAAAVLPALRYVALLALVVVVAVYHPDHDRRGEARRVLMPLLVNVRPRRR